MRKRKHSKIVCANEIQNKNKRRRDRKLRYVEIRILPLYERDRHATTIKQAAANVKGRNETIVY